MQNIYLDTRVNDKALRETYELSEELMMENAAYALESEVKKHCFRESGFYIDRPNVLILCGKGNNGADGYALARRLMSHHLSVTICAFGEPKTDIAQLQKKRAVKAGAFIISPMEIDEYLERISVDLTCIVDCIYGTGFHDDLGQEEIAVITELNQNQDAYRIACDVPSGLDLYGKGGRVVFKADTTVAMGALKLSFYSDRAKDLCGNIVVADLGMDRGNFENAGDKHNIVAHLLESSDMELPYRNKYNVHKGSFGQTTVIAGDKIGAAVLAGTSALNYGAGLVTLVSEKEIKAPYELMTSKNFPVNCASMVIGMGLGKDETADQMVAKVFETYTYKMDVGFVLDADIFYNPRIVDFLAERSKRNAKTVLTPHPKEFASLLNLCGIGEFLVDEINCYRIHLVKKFCNKYPGIVLVLKGANVIIAVKQPSGTDPDIYINTLGSPALAKAGSGDVLSGLIAAELSRGNEALKSAVNASLAHALASRQVVEEYNDYALTPFKLIEAVTKLQKHQ